MSATLIEEADKTLARYDAIWTGERLGMEKDLADAVKALRGRVLELEELYRGMRSRQNVERELRQMESLDSLYQAAGSDAIARAGEIKHVLRWVLAG